MKKKLSTCLTACLFLFSQINNKYFSQSFTDSNLPIVVINTGGQLIDSAWFPVIVSMGIIDNGSGNRNHVSDPFNNYNGNIEIKIQGSSTVAFPKKSFRVTTITSAGVKYDMPLFGLPAEHDWVFKASYQDKTFLRDEIAFRIFNQMGYYSSRIKYFELVVDGDYRGIYICEEKVKRSTYRVNVSKLKISDTVGDRLTGGYIIGLDKFQPGIDSGWYSNHKSNATHDSANFFLYTYPKPDSMPAVQKKYIRNFFDKFENVLTSSYFTNTDSGYSKYINVASFADNFILTESSRNVDGYRASTFFYKDRDTKGDGKLHAVPVWDYNLAWSNCSYNGGNNPAGWQYQQFATINYVPFWWWQFMADGNFKNTLRCRYENLRTNILNLNTIYQHIDSMAAYLNEAQARNFSRWPILGQVIYPNPTPVPNSYAGEITNLKNWFQQRLTWMDANLPGPCIIGSEENALAENNLLQTFPNPFTDNLNVAYKTTQDGKIKFELLNLSGGMVMTHYGGNKNAGTCEEKITTSQLAAGMYILRLSINDRVVSHQKLIKLNN